jgi:hypothetical protein
MDTLWTIYLWVTYLLIVVLPMTLVVGGFVAWIGFAIYSTYTEAKMSAAEQEELYAERRADYERTEALIYGAVIDPIGRSIRAQALKAERNLRRAERELERMS